MIAICKPEKIYWDSVKSIVDFHSKRWKSITDCVEISNLDLDDFKNISKKKLLIIPYLTPKITLFLMKLRKVHPHTKICDL